MFARLRIGQKLFLVNALSGVLVLVVAGGLLMMRNHTDLESRFVQRIQQESRLVAANMQAAVLFEDWDMAREVAGALLEDPAIQFIGLTDAGGNVRVETHRGDGGAAGTLVTVPVWDGDTTIGELRVSATDAEVWEASRQALVYILAITFAATFAGVLVSNRVQRVVTTPIARLSKLIHSVREGNQYELRGVPVYPDEVGRLTEDVNAMLAIIEARDRDLELKVAQRTQELEAEVEQRRQSDLARVESQQRFEQAFQYAPIGMAIVDLDGVLLQRNGTFDDILSVGPEAELQLTDLVHEEDVADLRGPFTELTHGKRRAMDVEARCRTADGRIIFVEASLAAVTDEEGKYRYAVLQLKDVTDAKELASELAHQARHDVLTGLANRRTLQLELEAANQACSAGEGFYSLAILDLDQFKVVNDTSGHAAGDALLVQISYILKEAVRPEDIVVRLGGDEFALLMRNCPSQKAYDIANFIRKQVEELVFHWEGTTHRVGVSIGVVCVTDASGDLSDVMQRADVACFAAKEAGRNQVHLATDSSLEVEQKRGELHWVHRLHAAMDNDDLVLYVQPVLPLKMPEPAERLEVLLRMRNPLTGKLIPPGAFLPSAERYGLSVNVDRWVVKTLLHHASVYRHLFQDQRTYWINLTGSSFGDEAFADFLIESIRRADLPEGSVNFEITETAVVRNIKEASLLMRQLGDLGCHFALDDFGKGLSSFGYLKSLPVDFLKIDGMFIRDIADDEIDRMFVKSIIEIAHAMNMKTVAEFIENDDILSHVRALGADYGQGYGLGRPRPFLPQGVEVAERNVG